MAILNGITKEMLSFHHVVSTSKESSLNADKIRAEYSRIAEDGTITWCCRGRHGAIYGVTESESMLVQEFLVWFFGQKCCTWKKAGKANKEQIWNVEFVPMTKVSPPPKTPWGWCGTSILFEDWRLQEQAQLEAAAQFHIGDKVAFNYRGNHEGIVVNVNKRVTVISGNQKFYVVPGAKSNLRRIWPWE